MTVKYKIVQDTFLYELVYFWVKITKHKEQTQMSNETGRIKRKAFCIIEKKKKKTLHMTLTKTQVKITTFNIL